MEDQLISFETAKLAKEKEFNLLGYGLEDNECRLTQSLLQRWLRKVHEIHLTVMHRISMEDKNEYYDWLIQRVEVKYRHFTTWEIALENGLFEALKLI